MTLIRRSITGTGNWEYLVRYVSVGAAVVFVDLVSFQSLVIAHVWLPLTTTVAFALATLTHFSLNKLWTFRVRGKPHAYQLGAYVAVLSASFVITQTVVLVSVEVLRLAPLAGKVAALFVQLPVSFFGHRYFTFRHGRL
jgi:putative flippase GtrA